MATPKEESTHTEPKVQASDHTIQSALSSPIEVKSTTSAVDDKSSSVNFIKNAYPFFDVKKATKEVAMGVPSFLASYALTPMVKKTGQALFPYAETFSPYNIAKPTPSPLWHKHLPLNKLIDKNFISAKSALRFHAPITEEIFFRGLLMPGMDKGFKTLGFNEKPAKFAAILGNSLLFSALHPKAGRVASLINGLLWSTLTYAADGSLIPSTAGHMANNAVVLKLAELTHGRKLR